MIKSSILLENFGTSDYGGPPRGRIRRFGAAAASPMGLAVGGSGALLASTQAGKAVMGGLGKVADAGINAAGTAGKFVADLAARRQGGTLDTIIGTHRVVDGKPSAPPAGSAPSVPQTGVTPVYRGFTPGDTTVVTPGSSFLGSSQLPSGRIPLPEEISTTVRNALKII